MAAAAARRAAGRRAAGRGRAMTEPRRYTIKIDVEVRDQDDFVHFQPSSVTARATDLGVEWGRANDEEKLHDFFEFYLRTHIPAGMSFTEYGAPRHAAARRAEFPAFVDGG